MPIFDPTIRKLAFALSKLGVKTKVQFDEQLGLWTFTMVYTKLIVEEIEEDIITISTRVYKQHGSMSIRDLDYILDHVQKEYPAFQFRYDDKRGCIDMWEFIPTWLLEPDTIAQFRVRCDALSNASLNARTKIIDAQTHCHKRSSIIQKNEKEKARKEERLAKRKERWSIVAGRKQATQDKKSTTPGKGILKDFRRFLKLQFPQPQQREADEITDPGSSIFDPSSLMLGSSVNAANTDAVVVTNNTRPCLLADDDVYGKIDYTSSRQINV